MFLWNKKLYMTINQLQVAEVWEYTLTAGDADGGRKLRDHYDFLRHVQHHHTAVRETGCDSKRLHRTPFQILDQRVRLGARFKGREGTLALSGL